MTFTLRTRLTMLDVERAQQADDVVIVEVTEAVADQVGEDVEDDITLVTVHGDQVAGCYLYTAEYDGSGTARLEIGVS